MPPPGAIRIAGSAAASLLEALEVFGAIPLDKMGTAIDALLDGIALGRTRGELPDADNLGALAEDLAAQHKDEGSKNAFDLGRKLGREASAETDAHLLFTNDTYELVHGTSAGLSDPLSGGGSDGEKQSPVAQFSQNRSQLEEEFGAAVEQLSLAAVDPRVGGDPGSADHTGTTAGTVTVDNGAPDAVIAVGATVAVVMGAIAIGAILAGPVGAGVVSAATAEAGGITALSSAATAMGFAIGGAIVKHTAERPSELDGPIDTDLSLEAFFNAAAEGVARLVLKPSEENDAARPEDIEAFKLELVEARWQTVSRPAGTDDGIDTSAGGGLDPDDLTHELDPEWDGPSPIPDDINPSEPIDPTGVGGLMAPVERDLLT